MPKFSIKIKTSIMTVFTVVVILIVGTIMFFQYKSSSEFALLTTQKVFDRISDKVINQIEKYDDASIEFINLSKNIKDINNKPDINKRHILLPIITQYIKNSNYVYGIYMGYKNDNFYIVYNLNLSDKMKKAQNAPIEARWLIKKHIKENEKIISYKEFVDKDFNIISTLKESTTYRATQRPWYKDAIKTDKMIKTKPYIFSSIQQPGITYSQVINKQEGVILSLDITLNSLSKLLSKQNLVKGSASYIFKKDGNIIGEFDEISKNIDKNINKKYHNMFIKDNKIQDLEKQILVTIDGKKYLKYTTLLKSNFNTKDYLTIVSPMDIIMKPYKEKIYETLLITILIILLIIIPIIIYAVRLIVKPILQLQMENNKIENGKFNEVIYVESFMIEISDLSNSLVTMSNAIKEKTAEITLLLSSLEIKIEKRTSQLAQEKENVEQILANILLPVLITSKAKRTIIYANKFAQDLYETNEKDIINSQLDKIYTLTNGPANIIKQLTETGKVNALEENITIHTGKKFVGLLSVIPIRYNNEDCYIGMTVDITKQKDMENEVRAIHKHTRESIEYASLIQGALLPNINIISRYFKDQFVLWTPKDTVGGDIYLFEELRDNNECLLMFIDCTGHGVPGAFVTMLVKAVERQIVAEIKSNLTMDVSPAWILGYFNKSLKRLLKQETSDSISNAGFDGGIIYYNKKDKILKFAGAETPLFYIDENKEFQIIKGNRYSVGYKRCNINYEYKEIVLEVKDGMQFYCTTDGYLDQNGGKKDFPFGKKRFGNIIKEYHNETMADHKELFINKMDEYEEIIKDNIRNDDMTVIGFTI